MNYKNKYYKYKLKYLTLKKIVGGMEDGMGDEVLILQIQIYLEQDINEDNIGDVINGFIHNHDDKDKVYKYKTR